MIKSDRMKPWEAHPSFLSRASAVHRSLFALRGAAGVLACAVLLASCGDSSSLAGNSANTGNAQAVGRIVRASGAPATDAWVFCRPDSLLPWEAVQPGWSVRTDSGGRFRCRDLPPGPTAIEAREPSTGLAVWTLVELSADRRDTLPDDTLAMPARIRVALPPGTTGTLVLSGLTLQIPVRGEQEIVISGVPAGWTGSVLLVSERRSVVDSGLHVRPGETDSAGYTRTSARIRVPLAGGLAAAVVDLPLLIRLDSSWSGFDATLPDGSDLRLATTEGRGLPLEVATWDRAARTGALWTMLDTLKAPGDSVDFVLSWGIPAPQAAPARPFAASRGWIASWPLGDTAAIAADRIGAFPGTPTSVVSVPGVVARASGFDGRLSKIVIPGSSAGALDVPEGGPYTFSCWVRLKNFGTSRFVMGRGELGSHLKFQATYGADTNSWLANDFRTSPSGGRFVMAEADTAVWTHLAMTVRDTTVSLYVDGSLQNIRSGLDLDATGRRAVPFAIGAAIDTLGATSQHFIGEIDEAWVQGVVRSPAWIRFVAANQKPGAPAARPAK